MKYRRVSKETFIWNTVLFLFIFVCVITIIVPILYLLALSLVSGKELAEASLFLWPRQLDITAYRVVLHNDSIIWQGYAISLFRVVIGTFLATITTFMLGYGIACKTLPGRKFFVVFILITAFFNGGIIPNYMVIRNLGLLNSVWVYILPNLCNAWCVILMMKHIQNVPQSIIDAAALDGANTFCLMFRFVLPIAFPAVISVSFFYAIAQWNAWIDAYMYVRNADLQPAQMILRNILVSGTHIHQMIQHAGVEATIRPMSRSVQAAAVMVYSVPILVFFPVYQHFLQKTMDKENNQI